MLIAIFIVLFLIATYFCFRNHIRKHFTFQIQFTLEPTERIYDGEEKIIPPGGRFLLVRYPIPVKNIGKKDVNFCLPPYGSFKVMGKDEKFLRLYE